MAGTPRLKSVVFWLVLLSPGALPLLAWPLPFQDAMGHNGLIGAVYWKLVDPTRLDPTLQLASLGGPNRFYYALPVGLSLLLGPDLGSQWATAASMASVAPLAYLGLRSAGLDPRWAVTVPPLVFGRILTCGFLPNLMAWGPLCVVIGCCLTPKLTRRMTVLLFVACLATAGTHSFLGLVALCFLATSAAIDSAGRRFRDAASRATGAIFIAVLIVGPFAALAAPGGSDSAYEVVKAELVTPDVGRIPRALEWTMAWIREVRWDNQLQWAWITAVGLAGALGIFRRDARVVKLACFAGGCLIVLLTFGERFGPPVNWWGGWLRVPSILFLLAVFAASFESTQVRLRNFALAAAVLVSLTIVAANLRYISHAARSEFDGLLAVIDSAPPGKRVCNMWFYDESTVHNFPGYPHLYVANEYILRKGGNASRSLFSNRNHLVFSEQYPVRQPQVGFAGVFRAEQHMQWCELFLLRVATGQRNRPFANVRNVEPIADAGRWRLWRKTP